MDNETKRPYNILFITTDQEHFFQEYPEETAYKARKLLAELGTTFEKHYICSNMSTSSRSVIYTGTHITDTKMIDNTDFPWQGALDPTITTVGDRMREAGYYTAYKGKWHMGDSGILEDTAAELTSLEDYGFSDWGGKDYIGSMHEGYHADPIIAQEAADWLKDKGTALNKAGTPFFLAVNLVNPHDIMEYNNTDFRSSLLKLGGAPEDTLYDKKYDVPVPAGWDMALAAADVPEAIRNYHTRWSMQAGAITKEADWKDYQDYYLNCIQDSDNNIMKILDALRAQGLMDNTIIVFTSDHGELHGSHGLKGKGGMMYDHNIHVPLTIVHPDHPGGARVCAVTSHMDLAPTFLDMAGRRTPELAGSSLLNLMDGTTPEIRDGALFCYEMLSLGAVDVKPGPCGRPEFMLNPTQRGMVRGIVTPRYKYVRYFAPTDFNMPETLEEILAHNDIQLFDLERDPAELHNLAADPAAHADLILQMNRRLNELIRREIGTDDGQEVLPGLNVLM